MQVNKRKIPKSGLPASVNIHQDLSNYRRAVRYKNIFHIHFEELSLLLLSSEDD